MNCFKNVSQKNIIIGDVNITWSIDRIIDLDSFDPNLLYRCINTLKDLIDKGWIIACDECGSPIKTVGNKVDALKIKKEERLDQAIQLVEYAKKKDDPNFDPNELKKLGDTYILQNKVKLKTFLLMHHASAMNIVKSEKWSMDDLQDLKLVQRHETRKELKRKIGDIIWRLEHPKCKNQKK